MFASRSHSMSPYLFSDEDGIKIDVSPLIRETIEKARLERIELERIEREIKASEQQKQSKQSNKRKCPSFGTIFCNCPDNVTKYCGPTTQIQQTQQTKSKIPELGVFAESFKTLKNSREHIKDFVMNILSKRDSFDRTPKVFAGAGFSLFESNKNSKELTTEADIDAFLDDIFAENSKFNSDRVDDSSIISITEQLTKTTEEYKRAVINRDEIECEITKNLHKYEISNTVRSVTQKDFDFLIEKVESDTKRAIDTIDTLSKRNSNANNIDSYGFLARDGGYELQIAKYERMRIINVAAALVIALQKKLIEHDKLVEKLAKELRDITQKLVDFPNKSAQPAKVIKKLPKFRFVHNPQSPQSAQSAQSTEPTKPIDKTIESASSPQKTAENVSNGCSDGESLIDRLKRKDMSDRILEALSDDSGDEYISYSNSSDNSDGLDMDSSSGTFNNFLDEN